MLAVENTALREKAAVLELDLVACTSLWTSTFNRSSLSISSWTWLPHSGHDQDQHLLFPKITAPSSCLKGSG